MSFRALGIITTLACCVSVIYVALGGSVPRWVLISYICYTMAGSLMLVFGGEGNSNMPTIPKSCLCLWTYHNGQWSRTQVDNCPYHRQPIIKGVTIR